MPAPTAPLRRPEDLAESQEMIEEQPSQSEDLVVADAPTGSQDEIPSQTEEDQGFHIDDQNRPIFPEINASDVPQHSETREVPVPFHRMTPLRKAWPTLYPPLVENLKLQVRMNTRRRAVELRTSKQTTDTGALQRGMDFIKAFILGFDTRDAIALLRLDDLYIETFEVKDIRQTLTGDHIGRAVGRIAGKDGRTKLAIENASKTRIVLADQTIHILGGFRNIHIAREAVVSLVLGSQPSKVYSNLRIVASRMKERF